TLVALMRHPSPLLWRKLGILYKVLTVEFMYSDMQKKVVIRLTTIENYTSGGSRHFTLTSNITTCTR
ncbi:hypothetical protein TorRG33x02_182600, partial [Trema orientale]